MEEPERDETAGNRYEAVRDEAVRDESVRGGAVPDEAIRGGSVRSEQETQESAAAAAPARSRRRGVVAVVATAVLVTGAAGTGWALASRDQVSAADGRLTVAGHGFGYGSAGGFAGLPGGVPIAGGPQ